MDGLRKNIYMMGICGMGMGSLALLLRASGYNVRGSDENIFPPMSTQLRSSGIEICHGYKPENLEPRPDLVIVGNVIRKTNPEAEALLKSDIPYISMCEALREFFLKNKKPIVVAGTHGKSTTSTLATWALTSAGLDPGAFIGGVSLNWGKSFRLGSGNYFVVEGDEYDTAFFDKIPKFLHYSPNIVILTSIEFDHADIFADFGMIKKAFTDLLQLVPESGTIIANWSDPVVREIVSGVNGPGILRYGESEDTDCALEGYRCENGRIRFVVNLRSKKGIRTREAFYTSLHGHHNLSNILSVLLLCECLNITRSDFQKALDSFRGLKRRQEIIGEADGVLVIDDFAHHPTAVRATISAIKESFKDRRLVAVFEPRSNSSRRNIFQREYEEAFDSADAVFIKTPPERGDLKEGEKLNVDKIVSVVKGKGKDAMFFEDFDSMLNFLLEYTRSGDVVLFMSNGAFDLLPKRLFEYLVKRGIN